MPASLFFCIRNHNRFVVLGILVTPPIVPCSTMRVRATQQGALRKIRTLDNHRWGQPIQDVRCARRRVSVAEVECKSGSRPSPSEERLFSSPETSVMIETPPFRVRRIFHCHLVGNS